EAQGAIANNDLKNGLKLLKDAFEKGGHGVPRTMMDHVAAAVSGAAEKGACKLTGLARPRTYDLVSNPKSVPPGPPSIPLGPKGPMIAWTDAHEGNEHAYAVVLDEALRNTAEPIDITPEGTAIGRPELLRVGEKVVVTYWDAKGAEPGVKARFLDSDARIA